MKIGNVNLANPYILAPMAGVTDLPFRLLCKEQGAGLLCMEMISAKALQYKNKNTNEIWEKSRTSHSDKNGEWKVGLKGNVPEARRKITIGKSDGKIIKFDNK